MIDLQSLYGVIFVKDATQQKTQFVTEMFCHVTCFNKSKFQYLYTIAATTMTRI